jgi:hypothetical protein
MGKRDEGNPNESVINRERGRVGAVRKPEDIPKQGKVKAFRAVARYTIGRPKRPNIRHDNGFLVLGRRKPTTMDFIKLTKWKAILEGGEALRPDLTDALAAYRHFLEGKGKKRKFSYDRYVMNDRSGQITLKNAILDIQKAAVELWLKNSKPSTFLLTGTAIPCGSNFTTQFPYPATENWQKAIGGHFIWLSGDVKVKRKNNVSEFEMVMTLHAEDRYNFNPGAKDIATGIPDNENGIFEMTGLAHQYDHFSTLVRSVKWKDAKAGVASAEPQNTSLKRQPQDNVRVRNRI